MLASDGDNKRPGSPLPAEARPQRRQLGMIEMKRLTIALDLAYGELFPPRLLARRAWLGYLYELFNFCDGQRTLRQIARALSHEIGPVPWEVLAHMACDLERMGYLSVKPEAGR
jgi:hypothetical protein